MDPWNKYWIQKVFRLKYKLKWLLLFQKSKERFLLKVFDGIMNIPVHVQFNFFKVLKIFDIEKVPNLEILKMDRLNH